MILDALDADRLKRAVAHVQRNLGELDAARLQRGNQRLAEMQACGRRGDRSTLVREQRLIAVAVIRPIAALDVRWQGHVTDRVDRLVDRRAVLGPQADHAPAKKTLLENLAVEGVNSFKHHAGPWFQFLPRMHQRFPEGRCQAGV